MITLETGQKIWGVAGTNNVITYTLQGDEVGTADAFKRIAQGQLPITTPATLYTAPASTQTLIKAISLANTSASSVTGIIFYIGSSAAATTQIVGGMTIPANGTAVYADGIWQVYDANGSLITTYPVTLTGDVTGSGTGSIATTIANDAVTNAKLANMVQGTVKGRAQGAGTGDPQDIAMTGSGSSVMQTGATINPKLINGNAYIDTANSSGWAGSDIGAWINDAYAALTASLAGSKIIIGPGTYDMTTPVVCITSSKTVYIEGAGDGFPGATYIRVNSSTGTWMTLGGTGGNDGGVHLRDLGLRNIGTAGTSVGIQWGKTAGGSVGASGASIHNVSLRGFGTGELWTGSNLAYLIHHYNVKFIGNTTAVIPLGENNTFTDCLFSANGIGLDQSGAGEVQLTNCGFDDNTTQGIKLGHNFSFVSASNCRFENVSQGTEEYVNISAGTFVLVGGTMLQDKTSGTTSHFIRQTGGVVNVYSTVAYTGGATITQLLHITAGYANVNWVPAAGVSATLILAPFTSGYANADTPIGSTSLANYNTAVNAPTLVANTNTLVPNSQLAIPAAWSPGMGIRVGTAMEWILTLSKNAAGTGTFSIMVQQNTSGTISPTTDPVIFTLAGGVSTAAVDAAMMRIKLVWNVVGASGTAFASVIPIWRSGGSATVGFSLPVIPTISTGTTTAADTRTSGITTYISVKQSVGTPIITIAYISAQADNIG